MKEAIIIALPLIGILLGWILAKKKFDADIRKTETETENLELAVDASQIHNFKELIDVYRQISQDLKKELVEVHAECLSLKVEVQALKTENKLLKHQLASLDKLMKEIKTENDLIKFKK